MIDRVLTAVEILLLVWIVVQGEFIRFYEREVYRMHFARDKERRDWREQKRKQVIKKLEAPVETRDET
jgi:hypothetical protein